MWPQRHPSTLPPRLAPSLCPLPPATPSACLFRVCSCHGLTPGTPACRMDEDISIFVYFPRFYHPTTARPVPDSLCASKVLVPPQRHTMSLPSSAQPLLTPATSADHCPEEVLWNISLTTPYQENCGGLLDPPADAFFSDIFIFCWSFYLPLSSTCSVWYVCEQFSHTSAFSILFTFVADSEVLRYVP